MGLGDPYSQKPMIFYFFSLVFVNMGILDPNSNLPPKIKPLDFFQIYYLKQDNKLGDVKNWQPWNMYIQCAVT